jgi:hypothetical protein
MSEWRSGCAAKGKEKEKKRRAVATNGRPIKSNIRRNNNSRNREEEEQGIGEMGRESPEEWGRSSSSNKKKKKKKKKKKNFGFLALVPCLPVPLAVHRTTATARLVTRKLISATVVRPQSISHALFMRDRGDEPRDEPTPRAPAGMGGLMTLESGL